MNQQSLSAEIANSTGAFSELLDRRLMVACQAAGDESSPCLDALLGHFAAGGSRVRARICFDAGTRLGLTERDALLAATVCELLHNASLLQDDLLDRTPVRRGASSVWARYGDAVALCTGDLLLSAAYSVLADLPATAPIAEALRLVHRRTREVIVGEAAESLRRNEPRDTITFYEQQARGKSASLLSLALELPLLLAGYSEFLPTAHEAASRFAVAYQIADDLDDYEQDLQEGSLNLLLLLQRRDGCSFAQAHQRVGELAAARLASAEEQASLLPNHCAAALQPFIAKLRHSLAPRFAVTQAGH